MFSYAYYMTEIETRASPPKNEYEVAETIPWFEKLHLRSDAALEAAEMQRWKFESMKLELFLDIKQVYSETYYIAKAIKITEENIQLLKQLEGVARTMYTAGRAPFATIIKAQVELGNLENETRSLKDMIQAVTAELNAALNRSPNAPIPPPFSIDNPDFPLSDEDALSLATENNPDLRVLDHEIQMQEINLASAKKEFYPDITLGLKYLDVRETSSPGMGDSGNELMPMISLNIPIWFRKYRAGIREAESQYQAAQNERQNRQNEILAALKMALYQFRDADRRISLFQNTLIPTARESLSVSEQAFTTGKADFMNVIDAQRILLEFELSHERALADKNKKLAEIEKLLGEKYSHPQIQDQGKGVNEDFERKE
jgi:outer membrane protein TolC